MNRPATDSISGGLADQRTVQREQWDLCHRMGHVGLQQPDHGVDWGTAGGKEGYRRSEQLH